MNPAALPHSPKPCACLLGRRYPKRAANRLGFDSFNIVVQLQPGHVRQRDKRAYPSHLEFGLRKGLIPPSSLNNGQQVDLLLARITAPYYGISTFDDLPTPFRSVAVAYRRDRDFVRRARRPPTVS